MGSVTIQIYPNTATTWPGKTLHREIAADKISAGMELMKLMIGWYLAKVDGDAGVSVLRFLPGALLMGFHRLDHPDTGDSPGYGC